METVVPDPISLVMESPYGSPYTSFKRRSTFGNPIPLM